MNSKQWLTPEDVAELLQVCRATAYKVIDQYEKSGGNVWRPSKRMTRVDPDGLKKFLERK